MAIDRPTEWLGLKSIFRLFHLEALPFMEPSIGHKITQVGWTELCIWP